MVLNIHCPGSLPLRLQRRIAGYAATCETDSSTLEAALLYDSCLMHDEPEIALVFSRKMSLKGKAGCWGSIIGMDDTEASSLEQIRAFLMDSGEVRFAG